MRLKLLLLLSGLAWLGLVAPAAADLVFLLTPAVQSDVGSNEVFYSGTLINTSLSDDLYLNDIQFSLIDEASGYLTGDSNVFFANVPGILLPLESYSDIVFGITINPATPPGQYFGMATLLGGANIFATNSLAGPIFEVSLAPAKLGIAFTATNVALSWASPPGGFELQSNSSLTTTNWVTVTNIPAMVGGWNQVILSPSSGSQFYRLEYP